MDIWMSLCEQKHIYLSFVDWKSTMLYMHWHNNIYRIEKDINFLRIREYI